MKDASYRRYLLTILLVILAFSFVDRFALAIVLEEIKGDLFLSDTQLGFMTGVAFAAFYAIMGIPIARWADRGNRVMVISLTVGVWSVMVALCGAAGSFVQLLLIRIGVGVGEAGCVPAANSLIADYFDRTERPRAAAIYWLGTTLGAALGYFLAGWLNVLVGWRVMFVLLGAPGLVLAGLTWFTLREPREALQMPAITDDSRGSSRATERVSSVKEVCGELWANATFRHLLLVFCVIYFLSYGVMQWLPTFFIRSLSIESGELGTWFAVIFGVSGLVGTYYGGEWASRYAPKNERAQLVAAVLLFVCIGVIYPLIYLASNRYLAFAVLAVWGVGTSMVSGPLIALIQTLVPERMRATSIALILLFANLIGMGLGPLASGAISDALQPWAGRESLRYALLILSPGYLVIAWHFWQASKTVTRDLISVDRADADLRA